MRFVAAEAGPVTADTGMLALVVDASLDDVPAPEIVCVPGGRGTQGAIADGRIVDWVRAGARDLRLDDVGVHRRAGARRGRGPRRPRRDDVLDGARFAAGLRSAAPRANAWCARARS